MIVKNLGGGIYKINFSDKACDRIVEKMYAASTNRTGTFIVERTSERGYVLRLPINSKLRSFFNKIL